MVICRDLPAGANSRAPATVSFPSTEHAAGWGRVIRPAGSTVTPQPCARQGLTGHLVAYTVVIVTTPLWRMSVPPGDASSPRGASVRIGAAQKCWGMLPRFDADAGNVVAQPPGSGYGFWAGAPSALYDPESGRFYCYYRARWPLGDRRGGLCPDRRERRPARAARGMGGRLGSHPRAVRGELHRALRADRDPFSGEWRLYVASETAQSYDRVPATWRIDLLQAPGVARWSRATVAS